MIDFEEKKSEKKKVSFYIEEILRIYKFK